MRTGAGRSAGASAAGCGGGAAGGGLSSPLRAIAIGAGVAVRATAREAPVCVGAALVGVPPGAPEAGCGTAVEAGGVGTGGGAAPGTEPAGVRATDIPAEAAGPAA